MNQVTEPYQSLSPDVILGALEALDCRPSGSLLALNSYENRVYQVGMEEGPPLIVKFYRPGRWSPEAIVEEHEFCREMAAAEIPVVLPLDFGRDSTLHWFQDFHYAVFPRQGGRWPDLDNEDNLRWLGRLLGRVHGVGAARDFVHRPRLHPDSHVHAASEYLLGEGFIPPELRGAYSSIIRDIEDRVGPLFDEGWPYQRLYGDCHPGNILWNQDGPFFVDLDDCLMGPAVQDLWMLLSGNREEMGVQMKAILEGYEMFRLFDFAQLRLIEPLRTLRIVNYAAWLARRWGDPAFPLAFPWFNTPRFWEEHVLSLREQLAALDEPGLEIPY